MSGVLSTWIDMYTWKEGQDFYTAMNHIRMFRSMMDHMYNGGPIRLMELKDSFRSVVS